VSVQPAFSHDLRTIDELVNFALLEVNEELARQAVSILHGRGTAELLQYAKRLSTSPCHRERRLGADILGQLGVPDRTFPMRMRRDPVWHVGCRAKHRGINLRSDGLVVPERCRCHPAGNQVLKSFECECPTCRATCPGHRRVSRCDDVPRSHEPRYRQQRQRLGHFCSRNAV